MLDLRKACVCEPTGKLFRRIGPLYVLLERALPRLVIQPLEKIHPVPAETVPLVIDRAPDAVAVLRFIEKHLSVKAFQLVGRVDIEHKKPARAEAFIDAPECLLHVLRLCHVVDAVKRAHARVYRLGNFEPLHRLRNKKGLVFLQLHRLFRRHGQHFLRPVDAQHPVAMLCQQHGKRTRAAGQIEDGRGRYPIAAQKRLKKAQIFFIRNIAREPVVGCGQRLVAAHGVSSASSSFRRAKISR